MAILTRLSSFVKPFRTSLRKGQGPEGHYNELNDNTHPTVEAGHEENNCDKDDCKGKSIVKLEKATNGILARKRLCNEFSRRGDDVSNCSFGPIDPQDPLKLKGIIIGPSGTPFEGGIFFLSIQIPKDYPFRPPKIKFTTKVFHPNVTSDGKILIDILAYEWSPALSIEHVLLSICSFLPDPNHEQDSCNPVCDLYWNHRQVYNNIARQWTLKYAML